MKAIILAAGEGRRLRPLTNEKPKAMIEIGGKSLIQHQVDIFRECEINEIFIITGYLSDKINFKNIVYLKNENFDKTNMVETLFCAREIMNEAVIVSYGDIIFEKKILKKLLDSQEDLSVVIDKNWKKYWEVRFDDPLSDAESLTMDSDGNITSIGQKVEDISKIQGQYIGLMKFQGNGLMNLIEFYDEVKEKASKTGINLLNPEIAFEKSYMTDFLQAAISKGMKIKSIIVENGWLEVDSINDYKLYQKMISNGSMNRFFSFNEK